LHNLPERAGYDNGIELFNGSAILLKATEKAFEFCLNWGELKELIEFFNSEDTLDKAFDQALTLMWDNASVINTTQNADYGFFAYEKGVNATVKANVHPFVRLSKIITEIKAKSGLSFVFPSTLTTIINNIAILCMTKNDNPIAIKARPFKYDNVTGTFDGFFNNGFYYDNIMAQNYLFSNYIKSNILGLIFSKPAKTISVTANLRFKNPQNLNLSFVVLRTDMGHPFEVLFEAPFTNVPIVNYATITCHWTSQLSVDDIKTIGVYIKCNTYTEGLQIQPGGTNEVTVNIDPIPNNTPIPYPAWFPVYANLPQIKLIDIIKSICHLFGLYVCRNKDDFYFESIGIIYQNKPKAYDWSDRLINKHKQTPAQIIYRHGGMSQNNILKYSEGDDFNSQAIIEVDDETLPLRADLITLPFAATRMTDGIAVINQYTEKGVEVEFNELKPRLLKTDNANKKLTFIDLDFETLKNNYYQEYQRIMRRPIVITETFKLSELDLKNLDFTIPVYLRQYGQYYAIITIEDRGGICKAEMLQL